MTLSTWVDGRGCSLEELWERAATVESATIWDCPDLTTLPDLPNAVIVWIGNCPNLTTLPYLPNAIEVWIRNCPSLQNVIRVGRDSRGYEFIGVFVRGEWHVAAGCQSLTISQARKHWRRNPECLALVERIAAGIAEYEARKLNPVADTAETLEAAMTELEKLFARLTDNGTRRITGFNIFPGDGSASPEEIAAEINRVLDRLESGDFDEGGPRLATR